MAAISRIDAGDARVTGQVAEAMQALRQPKRASDAFDFVLIGDSRGGLDVLEDEMGEIDKRNPAFVLYSGDLVGKGTEREYREGLAVLKTVRAPVFPAIGNHERENGGIKWYYELFGKDLDYSFDYGNYRFISIDNSTGGLNAGQMAWLQTKLQTEKRKIVFAHMPPPLGVWWVHPFRGNYKAFMSTVEAAKVDACLFGHIHIYDKAEKRGIRYYVSGGGGAPLYKLPIFNSREGGAFYNYVVGHAGPDGVKFELVKPMTRVKPTFVEYADVAEGEEDAGETVSDF
jgi:3',5'-cyclic AMP phosphodiesterase CpdA